MGPGAQGRCRRENTCRLAAGRPRAGGNQPRRAAERPPAACAVQHRGAHLGGVLGQRRRLLHGDPRQGAQCQFEEAVARRHQQHLPAARERRRHPGAIIQRETIIGVLQARLEPPPGGQIRERERHLARSGQLQRLTGEDFTAGKQQQCDLSRRAGVQHTHKRGESLGAAAERKIHQSHVGGGLPYGKELRPARQRGQGLRQRRIGEHQRRDLFPGREAERQTRRRVPIGAAIGRLQRGERPPQRRSIPVAQHHLRCRARGDERHPAARIQRLRERPQFRERRLEARVAVLAARLHTRGGVQQDQQPSLRR
ncbi:MAG: hypothetical protein BWY25_01554 [Chloroflexi bacterium ADurb.Bin222]|nr:MAG: hypothetical protein BWY25_01554 [Chloroflexi bacterium ADurb.Bin222]